MTPPHDPRAERKMKAFGITIPPPPKPKIEEKTEPVEVERGPVSASNFVQQATSEARSTRFQISLLLLAAFICGAYYVGRDAGRGASKPEIEFLMSVHDRRLEAIARSLEAIRDAQSNTNSALSTIDSRLHNVNTEIQVVKSHLPTK